ncbi:uncharacterized protein LOC141589995 [Silene latifolia]|uniref:uncharacterized protein LOC141589995 n=1 Tax=Silene latifolia TaxID=37657 RepID=UPI003D77684A
MNNDLPDFVVPTNIALPNQSTGENEMEQFWRNIHVLDRNSYTKQPSSSNSVDTTPTPTPTPPPAPAAANNHLDMTDDELAAWLHYPLDDFNTEPPHPNPTSAPPPPTTVIPPGNSVTNGSRFGFPLISRIMEPLQRRRSGFTVVDSNDTPITSGGVATVGPIEAAPTAAGVTDSTTAALVPGGGDKVEAGEEVTTSPSSSSATATTTGTASTTGAICGKRSKNEEIEESLAAAGPATAPARIEVRLSLIPDSDKSYFLVILNSLSLLCFLGTIFKVKKFTIYSVTFS